MTAQVTPAFGGVVSELGESPRWDPRSGELVWIDMMAGAVHAVAPESGTLRSRSIGRPVFAVELADAGGYILVTEDSMLHLSAGFDRLRSVSGLPPCDRGVVPNDSAVTPSGRLLLGFGNEDQPGLGFVMSIAPDGTSERVLDGLGLPNGIGFSPDGESTYLVDSTRRVLLVFPSRSPRQAAVLASWDDDDGMPDGLAVDIEGRIWVAVFGGGRVDVLTAAGALAARVPVPVPQVTSVCLPGRDRPAWATTARWGYTRAEIDAQPMAGAVHALPYGAEPVRRTEFHVQPQ